LLVGELRVRIGVQRQEQGQESAFSGRGSRQRAATVGSGSDQVCDGGMVTSGSFGKRGS
jgi:hypothetical protein